MNPGLREGLSAVGTGSTGSVDVSNPVGDLLGTSTDEVGHSQDVGLRCTELDRGNAESGYYGSSLKDRRSDPDDALVELAVRGRDTHRTDLVEFES